MRFPIRSAVYFNDFGESRIPAPQINLPASQSGSHSPPPPHRIRISWKVVQPLAARHPEDARGVKATHRGDQPQALNNTLSSCLDAREQTLTSQLPSLLPACLFACPSRRRPCCQPSSSCCLRSSFSQQQRPRQPSLAVCLPSSLPVPNANASGFRV